MWFGKLEIFYYFLDSSITPCFVKATALILVRKLKQVNCFNFLTSGLES